MEPNMADSKASGPRSRDAKPRLPAYAKWSKLFLAHLAATSNVSASARKAGISTSTAYEMRRSNPDFNHKWQQALIEGYEHLEMELLYRLRIGESKPAAATKRATRSFDNSTAFRLLSAHREVIAKERAIRNNDNEEAILASIDAKLERMRQRQLAASVESADSPVFHEQA